MIQTKRIYLHIHCSPQATAAPARFRVLVIHVHSHAHPYSDAHANRLCVCSLEQHCVSLHCDQTARHSFSASFSPASSSWCMCMYVCQRACACARLCTGACSRARLSTCIEYGHTQALRCVRGIYALGAHVSVYVPVLVWAHLSLSADRPVETQQALCNQA